MTKPQSSLVDVATAMLRDLQEFNRSGGKEAFLKQLREEFVLRSRATSLEEALAMALVSLVPFCETIMSSRKRGDSRPSLVNRTGSRSGSQHAIKAGMKAVAACLAGYSMSTACRRKGPFGPAAAVFAAGLSAMNLFQSMYGPRPSECISSMPCKSGMEKWTTWLKPSPSSTCVVGSAVVVPILSALDLETALIVDGEWRSSTFHVAISCADVAINSPTRASTNNHATGHLA
jgi:hypothetical protein